MTTRLSLDLKQIAEKFRKYRFELTHLTILFIVLIIFQVIVSLVQKNSVQSVLVETQEWYQQDSAERLAYLTATSLELLLEAKTQKQTVSESDRRKAIQDFNIIFSQQILHQNVQAICILVARDTAIYAIDDGQTLYSFVFEPGRGQIGRQGVHEEPIRLYGSLRAKLSKEEQTYTILEGKQTFHVFVPFVLRGEFVGALYMRSTPDLSFMTRGMVSNYDETAVMFSALMLFGLLAMFYISSYTLRERNEAQQQLFEEQKQHLAEQINHQKEALFTKRIYHTHHKAEKVMGFIKEDLRALSASNIEEIKRRVSKYSNFIARTIYDMKWYDPPIQTIRNPLFRTDVNEVIRFIVEHIFKKVSQGSDAFRFQLDLDDRVPSVPINEYVVWEALEPIFQNCFDHAGLRDLVITVETKYDPARNRSQIIIQDNGSGIAPELLASNDRGVKKLFLEDVTTKHDNSQHSGYGCYIAYEISRQRCGWDLDAENVPDGGCRFIFTLFHES